MKGHPAARSAPTEEGSDLENGKVCVAETGHKRIQEEGTAYAQVRSTRGADTAGLGAVEELLGGEAGGGSGS